MVRPLYVVVIELVLLDLWLARSDSSRRPPLDCTASTMASAILPV